MDNMKPANGPIALARHDIDDSDVEAVTAALRSSHLSLGPKQQEFEQAFASFVGTKHAVAVNSGTAALHLCVRALNLGEGDEVITAPLSFIASSNCLLYERATVKFVDVLPDTFCIDPARIERAITKRTKAIIAVDLFGYLCDWEAIRSIASRHKLALIEDSCEALGSHRSGKQAGSFGDCGVFGFYPNKQMTTGEGGMVTTDRDDIALAARAMCNQGRTPGDAFLRHEHLGFNYRLTDFQCALGISQLKRLPEFIRKKQEVARLYAEHLKSLSDHIIPLQPQEGVSPSWFVYRTSLASKYEAKHRDALMAYLRGKGIGCSNYFPCIHLQPYYRDRFGFKGGEFPISEDAAARALSLPFHTKITEEEIVRVAAALKEGFATLSHD